MDDVVRYYFNLYRSQEVSDLRESRGNHDTMLILRRVAPPIWTSVDT